MRERATIGIKSIFRPEAARKSAIDAVRNGRLHPEYVIKHFGTASLLDLSPDFAAHFLQSFVHNNSFRERFLSDLGIMPQVDRRRFLFTPGPKMIPWIPSIEEALVMESAKPASKLTKSGFFGLLGWRGATIFFSTFAYPDATNALIKLLDNKISMPANVMDSSIQPISETVVGTMKQTDETPRNIPGGWQGVPAHNFWVSVEEYETEKIEQVYPSYEPVVLGATIALKRIAAGNPDLAGQINHAIAQHEAISTTCSVFIPGKEIPGTRNYARGYYYY